MAPVVSSIAPAAIPAGQATAVVITGTGFTASPTVVVPGCVVTGVSQINATTINATLTPAIGAYGLPISVKVTLTDTTTNTNANCGVVQAPVGGRSDISGINPQASPAVGSRAIDQKTSATFYEVNPGYAVGHDGTQSKGLVTLPEPIGPTNVDGAGNVKNVATEMNKRNQEADQRKEGLGDYVAGVRVGTLASPTT